MNLSDQRATELRQLFFESAQELVHLLNAEGLRLEANPGEREIVRTVRRAVHTLKGDSAVCGCREITELAHELEDVLDPDAVSPGGALAEVVLAAADTFDALLASYRSGQQPSSPQELRAAIRTLRAAPASGVAANAAPAVAFDARWTEYEQLAIEQTAAGGRPVYLLRIVVDPNCAMRDAAAQLIARALHEIGPVVAMHPATATRTEAGEETVAIDAAVVSEKTEAWIAAKCRIPALVCDVRAARHEHRTPGIPRESTSETAPRGWQAATGQQQPAVDAASLPSLRVPVERVDAVMNLVGEMIIAKSMLQQALGELGRRMPKDPLRAQFADAMAFHARVLAELQSSVMKIRMVEVRQLFRRVPRLVRDAARFCDKEVALMVNGDRTELDKSILDALAEPLMHLVRNAIDHGIEAPEARAAAGKPRAGVVRLNAFHHASHVCIEIADDGAGIDAAALKQRAVDRGVITRSNADALSDADALELMFEPGLSTSSGVTEISGRGVGMDIVKSTVERLKGTVRVESRPGAGTSVQMRVPLTLAIMKTLLFRSAGRLYAVPLASVVEIARARTCDVHSVERHEVLQLREQILPLIRMDRLGGSRGGERDRLFVIVVSLGERRVGLVVDRTVGEEELVIKAFDDRLVATELVSGASILGDGTVVLILNLAAVIERFGTRAAAEGARAGAAR